MKTKKRKAPRKGRRGLTLIELMIGSALSVFVTAAAFAFAQHQTRSLGFTSATLEMTQASRATIEILAEDIRLAGVGVGYGADGTFSGLHLGSFVVHGVTFNSNNVLIPLASGVPTPSDDIGIVMADGNYATIAAYSLAGSGEICAGSGIRDGELVAIRSEDGLAGRSVVVNALTASGCSTGVCIGGCESFTYAADPTYLSDSAANSVSYLGGEMSGALKTLVWFVEAADPARPGVGAIRRAQLDNTTTCSARDHTCGALMAEGIETLQTQVWRWVSDTNVWVNVTSGPIDNRDRLRVDIELVARARAAGDRGQSSVSLRLEPGTCLPSCITRDQIERRVYRTSVEIKNSGRMHIK